MVALPSDPAAAAPGDITLYPDANVLNARNIVTGPDGNLWFTSFQTARIGRIDPEDDSITTYTDADARLAERDRRRPGWGSVVHRLRRGPDRPDHHGGE